MERSTKCNKRKQRSRERREVKNRKEKKNAKLMPTKHKAEWKEENEEMERGG